MIAALLFMALIGWGCWSWLRDPPPQTTSVAAAVRPVARATTALGLEDDPDQWHATRGAWTEIDERQLIRLLTDSAPVDRPAEKTTDDAVTHVDHEDTP